MFHFALPLCLLVLVLQVQVHGQTYNVVTLAGSGGSTWIDGAGTVANIFTPYGIAIDSQDNVIVVEGTTGYKIKKITQDGFVSTIAGSGTAGLSRRHRNQCNSWWHGTCKWVVRSSFRFLR